MTLAAYPYLVQVETATDISIIDERADSIHVAPSVDTMTELALASQPLRLIEDDYFAALITGEASTRNWLAPLSQDEVLRFAEGVRHAMNWSADRMAELAGRSKRRYHEWLEGERAPEEQLAQILDGITLICEYVDKDPWTTQVLFNVDADAMSLVRSRDRVGLSIRWNDMRRQLARVDADPKMAIADLLLSPTAIAEEVGVEGALGLLEALLPATHAAKEAWRIEAFQGLARAIDQLTTSNSLPRSWAFLGLLNDEQLDAFRHDAGTILSSQQTRPDEWRAWIVAVEERTYAANDPARITVPEGEDTPTASAGDRSGEEVLAGLVQMGISLVAAHRAGR